MKQPLFSLFLLAILLVSSNFCLHAYGDYVYDTDGYPITGDSSYYIVTLPPLTGPGFGGLTPVFSHSTDTCSRPVVQSSDCYGAPAKFIATTGFFVRQIHNDEDVIIQFEPIPFKQTSCPAEPQVWTVEKSNSSDDYFVTTTATSWAATLNNSTMPRRPRSLPSLFKIQKIKNGGYQFRYCPSTQYLCDGTSCKDSALPCDNIGISEQNGKRRLALGGEPCQVEFRKRKARNYYFAETS